MTAAQASKMVATDAPTGRLEIAILKGKDTHPGLAHLWARSKVAALERNCPTDASAMDAMRDVALEFGLLSPATAFIAVDSSAPMDD